MCLITLVDISLVIYHSNKMMSLMSVWLYFDQGHLWADKEVNGIRVK